MNTNEFIKSLSIKDKKNLAGKFTKLIEETGELARVILPFESAHGTNHRFTDRESILEEIVDVHLCNISIAHSLGFTEEEFDEMLVKKSKKWSQLQASEEQAEFPLPFEIHITVDTGGVMDKWQRDEYDFEVDDFREVCQEVGVKPIVLDLEINGESPIKDVMTSSKHFGDNRTAYEESERIAKELSRYGYKVLRKKIETVPWHPAAPVISTGRKILNDCYFESHIGVVISPDQKEDLDDFVNNTLTDDHLIELWGTAKLSQNFFKKSKDGSKYVNMLTYRCDMIGKPSFILQVEGIKQLLKEEGFDFEKVEIEFAIYDTNVSHDSKWITG